MSPRPWRKRSLRLLAGMAPSGSYGDGEAEPEAGSRAGPPVNATGIMEAVPQGGSPGASSRRGGRLGRRRRRCSCRGRGAASSDVLSVAAGAWWNFHSVVRGHAPWRERGLHAARGGCSSMRSAGGPVTHVVFVGLGFGGLYTLRRLVDGGVEGMRVTAIDRRDHFVFTPLLYEYLVG